MILDSKIEENKGFSKFSLDYETSSESLSDYYTLIIINYNILYYLYKVKGNLVINLNLMVHVLVSEFMDLFDLWPYWLWTLCEWTCTQV